MTQHPMTILDVAVAILIAEGIMYGARWSLHRVSLRNLRKQQDGLLNASAGFKAAGGAVKGIDIGGYAKGRPQ